MCIDCLENYMGGDIQIVNFKISCIFFGTGCSSKVIIKKVFRCRCGDVIKRIFVDTESFKTGQRGLEVVLVVLGVELEIKVECSTTTLSETKNFYFF